MLKTKLKSLFRPLFAIVYISLLACSSTALYGCQKFDDVEDLNDSVTPYIDKTTSEFIAVFGDIQFYTYEEYIDIFKKSLNWLENNPNHINITNVLCTGDIVHNSQKQWSYFEEAMEDFSLPFITCIGNHDYVWENSLINDRKNTWFNLYVQFPLVVDRIEAAFEEGHMENIVVRNEIHGQRYDFLVLEFGPRKEVVEWAKNWVSSHPEIKYILLTHEYLEMGGERRIANITSEKQFRNTTYTTPDELWTQLVKCNDNIAWVICGHVGGLYAVTYSKNNFGRQVCQIEHNIQGSNYRYDNWIMMWEFPEDSDEANVTIVNAVGGRLYKLRTSLFTFKYRY